MAKKQVQAEEEEEYEVEEIKDHRKIKRKLQYFVSWVGWPGADTWIDAEDAAGAPALITAYWATRTASEHDAALGVASSAVKSSAAKKASSSAKKSAGTPSSSKAPPAPAVEEAPSPPADDIPAPADEPPVVKKRGRPSNPNKPAAAEEPAVPKKRGRRSNADIAAAAAAGHPFPEPKKRAPKAPKVVDGEGDDEGEAEGEDEGPAKGKGKGKAKAQPKAKGKAPRKSKVASAEPEQEQEQDPGSREENGDKEQGEEVVPTPASGSEAAGRVAASEPDDDAMEIDQAPALNAYEFPANPVYNLNAEDKDIDGRTYLGLERQFAAKEHDWEDLVERIDGMQNDKSGTSACLLWTEGTSFSWIPNPIVRIRCPQRLIDFYERHIVFPSDEEEE